jgi:excisionase family DNA binding protein
MSTERVSITKAPGRPRGTTRAATVPVPLQTLERIEAHVAQLTGLVHAELPGLTRRLEAIEGMLRQETLTKQQYCELAGIGNVKLTELIKAGDVRAIRLGRSVLIPREELYRRRLPADRVARLTGQSLEDVNAECERGLVDAEQDYAYRWWCYIPRDRPITT